MQNTLTRNDLVQQTAAIEYVMKVLADKAKYIEKHQEADLKYNQSFGAGAARIFHFDTVAVHILIESKDFSSSMKKISNLYDQYMFWSYRYKEIKFGLLTQLAE